MSAEAAVRALLIADAAVGAAVGTKVFPIEAPQDTAYPYVTYQLISDPAAGVMGGPSGYHDAHIQITAWATGYEAARALASKCRVALDAKHGNYGGVNVNGILCTNRGTDTPAPPAAGRGQSVYGRLIEVQVMISGDAAA